MKNTYAIALFMGILIFGCQKPKDFAELSRRPWRPILLYVPLGCTQNMGITL